MIKMPNAFEILPTTLQKVLLRLKPITIKNNPITIASTINRVAITETALNIREDRKTKKIFSSEGFFMYLYIVRRSNGKKAKFEIYGAIT